MTMPNDILNDTQLSLAAAIARLEIHRVRIEKLKIENVHLRNVLRAHGINPGEQVADDVDTIAKEDGKPVPDEQKADEQPIEQKKPIEMPGKQGDEEKTSDNSETHSILLHTQVENVDAKVRISAALDGSSGRSNVPHGTLVPYPGRVSFKPDRIEFVAVAGDIRPDTFVGVRYLGDKPAVQSRVGALSRRSQPLRSSGGNGTWWDSLFGSQGDLPSAGSLPGAGAAFPPRYQTTPTGVRTPRSNQSESPALSPRAHASGFTTIPVQSSARTRAGVAAESGQEPGSTSIVSQMSAYLRRRSLPDAPVTWDQVGSGEATEGDSGIWQIIWRDQAAQGSLQTLTFETSTATRARMQSQHLAVQRSVLTPAEICVRVFISDLAIKVQVEQFQSTPTPPPPEESKRNVTTVGEHSRVRDPEPLIPGTHVPQGVEGSAILSKEQAACVANAIPGRKKLCNWTRLYCSEADGFSLQTMYRAGTNAHNSVLIVEDFSGHVFGAYCTDPLKVNPRYQGNGECFVFQLLPHRVKYDWHHEQGGVRNDFFMMIAGDSIGIGGGPHFAIWLDSDLLYGNSGRCHTFSSPSLSGQQDFKVKSVELWGIK